MRPKLALALLDSFIFGDLFLGRRHKQDFLRRAPKPDIACKGRPTIPENGGA